MDGPEHTAVAAELPPEQILDPAREPSVVASHVDITYRVFGAGADTGTEEQDKASVFRRFLLSGRAGVGVREVRAVRDVSFVAYRGESIGLIGRNGSGKSTLLRSIAGLVPPTQGKIWLGGRAALLGVSAVLLPKLTGRQNVRIGCLAQGLTPAQVDAMMQEIIDFADIGRFIDLPMHTYSSGMGARLRFAISTATVPDILVVDEALATGDAAFKEKAQERIEEFREQAGTVFMVSHNRSSIEKQCDRVLWIDEGRVLADGDPESVFGLYSRKYGKHRHVWRERFEEAKAIERLEGPEAAADLLDRWERRARRVPRTRRGS